MERLGKPRHGREGRKAERTGVSESNPVALPPILQREVSTPLDMTVDRNRVICKVPPRQWSLPSPLTTGKTARANDSFQAEGVF
jgi:hypothetical protein